MSDPQQTFHVARSIADACGPPVTTRPVTWEVDRGDRKVTVTAAGDTHAEVRTHTRTRQFGAWVPHGRFDGPIDAVVHAAGEWVSGRMQALPFEEGDTNATEDDQ